MWKSSGKRNKPMNARTPYWPLFRNELGVGHYPGIPWAMTLGFYLAIWLLASSLPLLILFKTCEGNLATFFTAFGVMFGFALVWWVAITAWLFAFALLPGISNPIQSVRAFEFMFTRAIDRRRLFRTRTAVIYLVLLGPLLLNLLVSAGSRETTIGADTSDPGSAALRREQYSNAFPASRPKEAGVYPKEGTVGGWPITALKLLEQPAPMVIPRAAMVLSAWILWMGTLGLLLMQGYCVLVARHVQNNPWLAGMAIGGPIVAASLLAPWIPKLYPDLFEQSFLFFARNLVPLLIGLLALVPVVQIFSERRFSKLEIH